MTPIGVNKQQQQQEQEQQQQQDKCITKLKLAHWRAIRVVGDKAGDSIQIKSTANCVKRDSCDCHSAAGTLTAPNLDRRPPITAPTPCSSHVGVCSLTLDFDAGGGLHTAQAIVGLATIRARRQLAGLEQNEAAVGLQLQCGRGLGQLAAIDEPLYVWQWPTGGGTVEQYVPGTMQRHNLVVRLQSEMRWRWCRRRIRCPHLIAAPGRLLQGCWLCMGVQAVQAVQTAVGFVDRHAYGRGLDLAHLIASNALVDANVVCVHRVDAQRPAGHDLHVWRLLHTDLVGVVHPDEFRLGQSICITVQSYVFATAGLRILGHVQELRHC